MNRILYYVITNSNNICATGEEKGYYFFLGFLVSFCAMFFLIGLFMLIFRRKKIRDTTDVSEWLSKHPEGIIVVEAGTNKSINGWPGNVDMDMLRKD